MINWVAFPPLSNANEDGLLAMGGELNKDILISAYSQGIFPWFNPGQPILWWSPNPRLVLFPHEMKVSRSLKKVIRQNSFRLTMNQSFDQVIQGCAWRGLAPVQGEPPNSWITNSMTAAYLELFKQGYAHSVEVWLGEELVGGLYGVVLGDVFFGESMFSRSSNASKVALWGLSCWLQEKGFSVIDCQVTNDHLLSLGAREISRSRFMTYLNDIDPNRATRDFSVGFQ